MNTFAIGSLPVHFSVAKLFTFRWQYTSIQMRGSMPAFLQVLMSEYTMAARYADASLPQKSQFLRPSLTYLESLGSRVYVYDMAMPILLFGRTVGYVSSIHFSKTCMVGYDIS